MNVRILQIHKRSSYEHKFIQDKYGFSSDGRILALADGTTQSFKSEYWAEIVCKNFILDPVFEPKLLLANLRTYAGEFKQIKFKYSTQPAKASLEKSKEALGGTSTLIGLRANEDNTISYVTIGDSNIFLLRKDETTAIPFANLDELDLNNYFLNTQRVLLDEVDESNFVTGKISLKEGIKVIVATDALSRLFLQNPDTQYEFLQLSDFSSFHNFCVKYWDMKLLQEDDITAFVIDVKQANSLVQIIPPEDFSFPKEEEFAFKPSNDTIKSDMQPLINELQIVVEKQKQLIKVNESQKRLLLISLTFSIVSFFLLGFVGYKLNALQVEQDKNSEREIQQLNKLKREFFPFKASGDSSRSASDSAVSWKKSVESK